MTNAVEGLVERLRAKVVAINGRGVDPAERDKWGKRAYENPDGPEAADRIEQLEAQLVASREALTELHDAVVNGLGVIDPERRLGKALRRAALTIGVGD